MPQDQDVPKMKNESDDLPTSQDRPAPPLLQHPCSNDSLYKNDDVCVSHDRHTDSSHVIILPIARRSSLASALRVTFGGHRRCCDQIARTSIELEAS